MRGNKLGYRHAIAAWETWGALVLGAGFTLLFFLLTSRHYQTFDLYAPDVDYFDQAIWNTLHGNFLYSSIIQRSILSFHFTPIFALLAPFFLIWDDVRILFLVQNIAVAACGLILFHLLRRRHKGLALLFLLAFYLNPALHEVALHELRRVILAMPFLALAVYGLHYRRYRLLALGLGLALLCKEDMGIIMALAGGYLLLFRREWRWGTALLAAGTAWFFIVTFYVIPLFAPDDRYTQLAYYARWGEGPAEIVTTIVRRPLAAAAWMFNPGALRALGRILLPLGLVLPFLAADITVLALPSVLLALLSSHGPMHRLEDWYMAPVLPILFGALAIAAARLPRPAATRVVGALAATSVAGFLLFSRAPLGGQFEAQRYALTSHHHLASEMVAAVPPDAGLAVQDAYLAHLTHRQTIYRYPWIHDLQKVQYFVLDRRLDAYPLSNEELVFELENLVADPALTVRREADGIYLLQRGGEPLPSFDVNRVAEQSMQLQKVEVAVADAAGFYEPADRLPPAISPGQTMRVSLYWRALDTPPGERTVSVRLATEQGSLLAQQDMQPSNGARPTSWWEPGWYFRDVYYLPLPPGAAPGSARLELNLYDTFTQESVPFAPGEAPLFLLPVRILQGE